MRERLIMACSTGDYAEVKSCLRHGDSFDGMSDVTKQNPLCVAVEHNQIKIIRLLLFLNATRYIDIAWHIAAYNGRYDIARLLKPNLDYDTICKTAISDRNLLYFKNHKKSI